MFTVTNTIKDIPRQDWDSLFGDTIEGYGYQKTLEESGLKEFSFGYLLGKSDGKLITVIPFFVMDFSFATLTRGALRNLILGLQKFFKRFLKMKILFLGAPTTEEFYFGFDKSRDLNMIMDEALAELSRFCQKEKISGFLFYNLSQKDKLLAEHLKAKKFIEMESLPTTLIKIEASSWEDYIKRLSKNMRKDLKRKLKRSASQAQLTTELRDNISDIAPHIYQLYLNNFNQSDVSFELLTPNFFLDICRNMPGVAKFFVTYDKDKIVAFNLCLIRDGLFIDKTVGFDSRVAHKYHLYYTTFCHNLSWCIKNSLSFYQPGTTDYYPKIRLGAKLIPLYIYARAFNPLLDALLRSTAKFIEPKNLEPALRDIANSKKEEF